MDVVAKMEAEGNGLDPLVQSEASTGTNKWSVKVHLQTTLFL